MLRPCSESGKPLEVAARMTFEPIRAAAKLLPTAAVDATTAEPAIVRVLQGLCRLRKRKGRNSQAVTALLAFPPEGPNELRPPSGNCSDYCTKISKPNAPSARALKFVVSTPGPPSMSIIPNNALGHWVLGFTLRTKNSSAPLPRRT
jgi:hypothetical protein